MAIVKMSIHRCLAELKNLNNRIESASNAQFILTYKKGLKNINGKTIEDTNKEMQSNFDKVTALIRNHKTIKDAIIQSNAITFVEIGGISYTVAQAIERKNSIHFDKNLLSSLLQQYNSCTYNVDNNNKNFQTGLEKYLMSILGDKDKRDPEDIELHTKAFEKRNTLELLDPIKISAKIAKLEDEISKFETEVNYKLSESNATTFVDIDFID